MHFVKLLTSHGLLSDWYGCPGTPSPPPSHLCLVPEEGAVPPGGGPETLCVLVLALGSVGESPSVSLLLNWLMGFAQLERRYICDPQLLGDKLCNKGGV